MRKRTVGFTAVEIVIIFCILGILAAVAVPAFLGYRRADKARRQSAGQAPAEIGRQGHRGMSAAPPSSRPLAIGTNVLVASNRMVTFRNPESLSNIENRVFGDGDECGLEQDWTLEAVGTEGSSTLFRLKAYVDDPKRSSWAIHCPIGSVFFLEGDETQRLLEYTATRELRQKEAQLEGMRESEAAKRLLEEYDRQHR